ncbi:MAG: hypothetical protein K1X68_11975 [Saprospiraceae bacterium]|nr:hypothetical protein [Saprospiraceae bacterium]HMX89332.1 hypothetical protein [Saprospiraceae bacterium]HMZ41228.1 hypothetical protein [Saprospiraceae bacterium]HNB30203.1 hypothetical protein [Saprospiraceae bacterium]HNC36285.1 hypothetical protein [Saprospiraceae bacterium]
MKQTIFNQPKSVLSYWIDSFDGLRRPHQLIFLLIIIVGLDLQLIACKNTDNLKENPKVTDGLTKTAEGEASNVKPLNKGFPSQAEFYDLLMANGNEGFARLLNESYLNHFINVNDSYEFVFLVPSEKNQDPMYEKRYLGKEATPQDKLDFWLSHVSVASKGVPYEGNPSLKQTMLKRSAQIISYEGGAANIVKEVKLKDGTQVLFLDKPLKISEKK